MFSAIENLRSLSVLIHLEFIFSMHVTHINVQEKIAPSAVIEHFAYLC